MAERAVMIEGLHRRYAGVLYDKSVRMLGDHAAAEDAVQETFISAFRNLEQFSYGESHLPWLYRICTNVCLKILRTRARKGAASLEGLSEEHLKVASNVERQLRVRRVLAELAERLDERSLAIVVAHHLDGMDQGQVAALLGISRRAVVKRLSGLRSELAQLIEDADD